MHLCVIGLGKMGSAIVNGILEAEILKPEEITGCDVYIEDKEANQDFGGIKTLSDNYQGAEEADLILLVVKPQVIDQVLDEIKGAVKDKLVVSVAAGVDIKHLKSHLPATTRVIRIMPNTPLLVKAGISAIAAGKLATKEDIEIVKEFFAGVGEVVELKEELIDAVTGLSGSGPAYIYIIIEALADAGVFNGLPRELALKLVAQTVLGSAKMVMETGKHPGELKDMVTSPAGTTINGVEVLEKNGLRGILMEAVTRATKRSKELNEM